MFSWQTANNYVNVSLVAMQIHSVGHVSKIEMYKWYKQKLLQEMTSQELHLDAQIVMSHKLNRKKHVWPHRSSTDE